jgi:cell division inhibitor SepF
MSVWSRTLVYLGLREEPDDAMDWQVLEDDDGEEREVASRHVAPREGARAPRTAAPTPSVRAVAPPDAPARATSAPTSNVRHIRGGVDVSSERVAVVHVRVFDDVETIGSRYRLRHPVLFDVGGCPKDVARRTVDFVSGLTYASRGTLRRTAPRAFLLVPEGLDIPLDERRRLSQLGYDVEGIAR